LHQTSRNGQTETKTTSKIRINDAEGISWDNGTIGNYRSDYNGTDSNGEGIGDTPDTVIVYKWDSNIWIIVPLFLTAILVIVFLKKG
jgi:hypothetical protein